MKAFKKLAGGVAKIAEVICMLSVAGLVLAIVIELLRRNFLGQSFTGNVQLCGILFLWMAFIGIIPLYYNGGLMSLDFLVNRTKGPVYEVLYFINKLVSLMLGVVMVIAFCVQLEYVGSRYYQTFPIQVPYTVQYVPMAIAGAYMALVSVGQIVEHIMGLTKRGQADVTKEET